MRFMLCRGGGGLGQVGLARVDLGDCGAASPCAIREGAHGRVRRPADHLRVARSVGRQHSRGGLRTRRSLMLVLRSARTAAHSDINRCSVGEVVSRIFLSLTKKSYRGLYQGYTGHSSSFFSCQLTTPAFSSKLYPWGADERTSQASEERSGSGIAICGGRGMASIGGRQPRLGQDLLPI